MAGLFGAVTAWTGGSGVGLALEGHGREDVIEGVDISRTVGWFTTVYPVVLTDEGHGDLSGRIKLFRQP